MHSHVAQFATLKNGSAVLLARVYGAAAALLTQASVASIAYSVYPIDDDDDDTDTAVTGHDAAALDVADTIYDTLQTGDEWTADSTGYNFRAEIGNATNQPFPTRGVRYRIEATITLQAGGTVPVRADSAPAR
jgi:hypothetical protein